MLRYSRYIFRLLKIQVGLYIKKIKNFNSVSISMETQIISNHKQHKPVSLICITKLEGQFNLAQVWGFTYA